MRKKDLTLHHISDYSQSNAIRRSISYLVTYGLMGVVAADVLARTRRQGIYNLRADLQWLAMHVSFLLLFTKLQHNIIIFCKRGMFVEWRETRFNTKQRLPGKALEYQDSSGKEHRTQNAPATGGPRSRDNNYQDIYCEPKYLTVTYSAQS